MKKSCLMCIFGIAAMFLLAGCQMQEGVVEKEAPTEIEEEEIVIEEVPVEENVPEEEPAAEQETPVEVAPAEIISDGKVKIIASGEEGFSQEEITIDVGDKVVFKNENPKDKDIVITLQKDGSQTFISTGLIKPGEEDELSFEESGVYTYWAMGFEPRAKIIVE